MTTGLSVPYTPVDVMFEALRRCEGRLGFAASATSVGTTYIIHTSEFLNSLLGDTDFQDSYIYRYNLTDGDRVKVITTNVPSTGQVNHGQSAYGNSGVGADLDYMFLTVHPDEFFNCILNAQHRVYLYEMRPYTLLSDGDMKLAGVDYWNGTLGGSYANCTLGKTTDRDKVDTGSQALVVALTAAGGGINCETVYVQPGQTVNTFANLRLNPGTVTFKMWDVDHSAYINTDQDVAYSGYSFATLPRQDVIPAGCYRIQPVFIGSGATDVIYIDSICGPLAQGRRRQTLPTWLNQSFKLPYIYEATYDTLPLATKTAYDSASRRFNKRFTNGQDFDLENFHGAANAYHVDFRGSASINGAMPLWMQTARLAFDAEPISGTDTELRAPFEEFMAYVMWDVAKLGKSKQQGDPFWAELQTEYKEYASVQTLADEEPRAQPTISHRRTAV